MGRGSTGTTQPEDPTTPGESWHGTGSTGMGLGELGWDRFNWDHPTEGSHHPGGHWDGTGLNWDGTGATGSTQPEGPTILGEPSHGTGSTGMGLGELGQDGVNWDHPTEGSHHPGEHWDGTGSTGSTQPESHHPGGALARDRVNWDGTG